MPGTVDQLTVPAVPATPVLEPRTPRASVVFDSAVAAAGVLCGLVALVAMLEDRGDLSARLLVAVPIIAVMSMFPLLLNRASGGIEIGFDAAVLAFLAVRTDTGSALGLWCAGVVLAQLVARKRPFVRLFNMGLGALAGTLALLTMSSLDDLGATSPRELGAVAAGCVVYFLVDYLLSGISIALEDGGRILTELRQPSAVLALVVFVAIDSLGYLAGLVDRALPSWATLLFAVPLATILVAARALTRGNEHRRRLAVLFQAAADAQTLRTRAAVLDSVLDHAHRVVMSDVRLRSGPPGPGELGAPLRGADREQWLVAPARTRARATAAADRQALDALVTVAEEAFGRIRLVEEMGHLARHDTLTGLANRALFLDRVQHAVAISRRRRRPLAVLFVDLDGFKAINDRFGHDVGDRLLQVVSGRISDALRTVDTVARLGGDEFAVLLEEVPDLAHVEQVCRRLLATFVPDIELDGHAVATQASIGVAFSTGEDDAGALLRNADMAMYRAKSLGKGRHAIYESSLREESLRRAETVDHLRRAVIEERLVVHYQPVVDLATGQVQGVEALVRWRRGEDLVSPDAFIALAEESGLIGDIGVWVLERAVADAAELSDAAGANLRMAVNVSASQLDSALVGHVLAAVRTLSARHLVLEMTEGVLIGDDDATSAVLRELVQAGAALAIDDFGVGFSSIGYLQHLPITVLKIDRSFVADIDTDDRALALVEAMVLMATALGLDVVAEGIERGSQLERLQRIGCQRGQGYLLGRPLPLDEACAALRERSARAVVLAVG